MHTLSTWEEETPSQRTERFHDWYRNYVETEGKEPIAVTVHEIWDLYGGPEEGGWTYRCGYPIETICTFSESQTLRILQELHEKYNQEKYDDGIYDICLSQGYAEFYPSTRPHYE